MSVLSFFGFGGDCKNEKDCGSYKDSNGDAYKCGQATISYYSTSNPADSTDIDGGKICMESANCNKAATNINFGYTLVFNTKCGPDTWVMILAIFLVIVAIGGVAFCMFGRKRNKMP